MKLANGKKMKIHVFTDCDLDGAASLLAFNWLVNDSNTTYTITRVTDFRRTFLEWLKSNNIEDYEKIFIIDLDVSQDSVDIVDRENIIIVDHHDTHVENISKYKNATIVIQKETSCAKLLYNTFKKSTELTTNQQFIIAMADDYDSYELKIPQSYDMNIVFWNYQGDRFAKFKADFGRGFTGFGRYHKNIIMLHKKKLEKLKNNIQIFEADIPVSKVQTKFISTFADSCINEIAEFIINKYSADVGVVVNLKSKKASFRKSKACKVNLGQLTKTLFKGGGHEYAAGASIQNEDGSSNNNFLSFSKMFNPKK
jgi:nanoRNase/pAp phosphatase (c-di-AMP/oligoRNAs hydrolase)